MAYKSKKKDNRSDRITSTNLKVSNKTEIKEQIKGGTFIYNKVLTLSELANQLNLNPVEVIKFLFLDIKKMITLNTILDDDLIELICIHYNYQVKKEIVIDEVNFEEIELIDNVNDLEERSPVVTIMGHVDHGKTTLLDTIRKSNVAAKESGGITQHIGAYQIEINNKKITFLDTPGHEAFTAMRARGSKITDIVIIVVAADDGVMPQTKEAIDYAKAANVPIIVAINKIDKPNANLEKIKNSLADHGLQPEEWGGDTIFCEVSALKNTGIENLLETILTVAEIKEYKANYKTLATGVVIEARIEKGKGAIATLLIQNGILKIGDPIVAGASFGKIRSIHNDLAISIKSAPPSTPVEITGLNEAPAAGDRFMCFSSEKKAREIGETRKREMVAKNRKANSTTTLEEVYNLAKAGDIININLIIKADVHGSAEAIKSSLLKLESETVKINIIRSSVGAITESDIILASASHAIVYGFNVRPDSTIRRKAEDEKVEIKIHTIIYDLIDEIILAIKGKLKPELKEVITGQAEVRKIFKISKIGTIAGCYVTEGFIKRDSKVRLIREGILIYEGELASLQRFKNEASEVKTGFECGIAIVNYNDLKENDIIESYVIEEIAPK